MKLVPKTNNLIGQLLEKKGELNSLLFSYGSPLGIVVPENVKENIIDFKDVLKKHNLRGKIHFAHKCTKSLSLIKEMLDEEINIDVASKNELVHALSAGFTGNKIEATGPKNSEFIILGLRHGIIFNSDSISEVKNILKYKKKLGIKEKVKILLRLNNFSSSENKFIGKQSRFGENIKNKKEILDLFVNEKENIQLLGFSFHLDTVNKTEKIIAIENILELFEECYEEDLEPYIINIGGGFKVSYLENLEDEEKVITSLKEGVLNGNNSNFWNGASFGLRAEKGVLKGMLNLSKYYEEITKGKLLDEILSTRLLRFQDRTVGEILSENMIDLMIEPGRSLIDLCGINLARITYIKKSQNGDNLIGLDMNRSNYEIGEQEMLVNPILLKVNNKKEINKKEKFDAFILGNLCMENDLIFKHKVSFDEVPEQGDILAFVNTAGYFMDFSESRTIMQNIAEKLAYYKGEFYLDKNFDKNLLGE